MSSMRKTTPSGRLLGRAAFVAVAAFLAGALFGCGSEAAHSSMQAASSVPPDDAASDAYVGCATDPRVASYAPGISAESQDQSVRVVLVASEPGPPMVGMNTWTVSVSDANDAAIADASLTVAPYMPDHGHGSPVVPTVTPNSDGTYAIAPLYFFMPGVWRIGITVATTDASPPSTVDFFFCVGG